MTDEAQPSNEQDVATLDDVISEYNYEAPVQQPQAKVPEPTAQNYVDPLNEPQWRDYQNRQAQEQSALKSQLQDVTAKLTQYEQDTVKSKVEAEINRAVKTVSEKSGIDNKDYVDFRLNKLAEEKPGFKKIWENREGNPNAFNKALDAFANELSGELDFKADPQLAENHRAATQSQQSAGTATSEFGSPQEENLAKAVESGNFEQEWAKQKAGG